MASPTTQGPPPMVSPSTPFKGSKLMQGNEYDGIDDLDKVYKIILIFLLFVSNGMMRTSLLNLSWPMNNDQNLKWWIN